MLQLMIKVQIYFISKNNFVMWYLKNAAQDHMRGSSVSWLVAT